MKQIEEENGYKCFLCHITVDSTVWFVRCYARKIIVQRGVKITQAETELILPVQICSIGVWFFNSVKTGGT